MGARDNTLPRFQEKLWQVGALLNEHHKKHNEWVS